MIILQLRELTRAMNKTGRPATITEDMQINNQNVMALDYAGDEAVTGNNIIYIELRYHNY